MRYLVIASVVGLAACLVLPGSKEPSGPVFETPAYSSLEVDREPHPGEVAVYTPHNREKLPRGISLPSEQQISLEPDVPTAGEPHRVLGTIELSYTKSGRSGSSDRLSMKERLQRSGERNQEAQRLITSEAARHGANAIYLARGTGGWGAYALWVSPAVARYPAAAAVLREINVRKGLRRSGSARRGLGAFETWTVKTRPYRCYTLVLALDADADLALENRRGLYVTKRTADPGLQAIDATPAFAKQRGHKVELGCTSVAGLLELGLSSTHKDAALGTGGVVMQLSERTISKAALRAQTLRQDNNMQRLRKEQCHDCYRFRVLCRESNENRCRRYVGCLAKVAETPRTCREMRR